MTTLCLPRRGNSVTYESAIQLEDNVILEASQAERTRLLHKHLWEQRQALSALAAHHLGLGRAKDRCVVQNPEAWIHGSFNVCVPVCVEGPPGRSVRKVLVRCPMGHKLANDRYPGTADEKLSCEAATYAVSYTHLTLPTKA